MALIQNHERRQSKRLAVKISQGESQSFPSFFLCVCIFYEQETVFCELDGEVPLTGESWCGFASLRCLLVSELSAKEVPHCDLCRSSTGARVCLIHQQAGCWVNWAAAQTPSLPGRRRLDQGITQRHGKSCAWGCGLEPQPHWPGPRWEAAPAPLPAASIFGLHHSGALPAVTIRPAAWPPPLPTTPALSPFMSPGRNPEEAKPSGLCESAGQAGQGPEDRVGEGGPLGPCTPTAIRTPWAADAPHISHSGPFLEGTGVGAPRREGRGNEEPSQKPQK